MNREDFIKIAKGAGLAAAGAILAYLSEFAIPMIQDGGSGAVLTIAAMASVAINALRKLVSQSEL